MNPAELVSILLNNLWPLLPFRIVKSFELAVRWTWGRNPKQLQPGFHWCFYVIHSYEAVTQAEEMLNLPTQSVVTLDDYPVSFSVNIGRRVTDAVKFYCDIQDFDASLEALSMIHLSRAVRAKKYTELVRGLDKLEANLKRSLETKCAKWGASITSVGFTDFVHVSQQIRLFQDKPSKHII